jgi:transposase-like protein
MKIFYRKYNPKEQREIARLVLNGQESVLSAMKRFDIGGKMTIYRWIKQFQEGKLQDRNPTFMAKSSKAASKSSKQVKQISDPTDELEILRLKVLAYETMIDIAEKELGISIKKKSFAKQSQSSEPGEENLA